MLPLFTRLAGVYLSFCAISVPVASLFMWRRGYRSSALWTLVAPVATLVVGLWEARVLEGEQLLLLALGVLPVVVLSQLLPISWLLATPASFDGRSPSPRGEDPSPWGIQRSDLTALPLLIAITGASWFLYALWRGAASCSVHGGDVLAELRTVPAQLAGCEAPALGGWLVALAWAGPIGRTLYRRMRWITQAEEPSKSTTQERRAWS